MVVSKNKICYYVQIALLGRIALLSSESICAGKSIINKLPKLSIMNICRRLLSDYNLGRLYNSYIIESDAPGQALSEIETFLNMSVFKGENLFIDRILDTTNSDFHSNDLKNFPDFLIVQKEDTQTKNISIEQIHELQGFLYKSSIISGFKIAVIYEAELMTEKAENACLKILEDTPQNSLIILVCTSAASILPTIKSRCVKICFKSHPDNTLKIDTIHLQPLNNSIAIQDRINFIQTFLNHDRKKWLSFANDAQKLIAKYLKNLLSPRDYILSQAEQLILGQFKYVDLHSLENKYRKIDNIIQTTADLDIDLRVSTIMIMNIFYE